MIFEYLTVTHIHLDVFITRHHSLNPNKPVVVGWGGARKAMTMRTGQPDPSVRTPGRMEV